MGLDLVHLTGDCEVVCDVVLQSDRRTSRTASCSHAIGTCLVAKRTGGYKVRLQGEMVQDLNFFFIFFSLWLRTYNFFPQKFLSHGSGLRIFFHKNLFAMVQTSGFFFQIFFYYGSPM